MFVWITKIQSGTLFIELKKDKGSIFCLVQGMTYKYYWTWTVNQNAKK